LRRTISSALADGGNALAAAATTLATFSVRLAEAAEREQEATMAYLAALEREIGRQRELM
jgi:hypothetical protein